MNESAAILEGSEEAVNISALFIGSVFVGLLFSHNTKDLQLLAFSLLNPNYHNDKEI